MKTQEEKGEAKFSVRLHLNLFWIEVFKDCKCFKYWAEYRHRLGKVTLMPRFWTFSHNVTTWMCLCFLSRQNWQYM